MLSFVFPSSPGFAAWAVSYQYSTRTIIFVLSPRPVFNRPRLVGSLTFILQVLPLYITARGIVLPARAVKKSSNYPPLSEL